ncbi:hypothetical protein DFQ05_0738 [Winogradskyella wandonensis]|uniref:DNA topoisomerase IV n=1 Tax=Winogradskyella wandonensis TaxID=1442586 RepID=A0A4R1KVM6_9FLAO|nr:hypothetical protein [Winogradskyella wandonensis]TCK69218.1 hypothetical protein DFQ05_0738 [Winogradskyella wandonensis]
MRRCFIFLICITFFSCYNVERNCLDYKTGTFKFSYTVNGEEKTGHFIRDENYSIDYFDGKIDSSSVRWINDCEFILKKINPQNTSEDDAIHMKILSTTDSSYTFEYKLAIKKSNRPLRVERGVAFRDSSFKIYNTKN